MTVEQNPQASALKTAESLREDLEEIAKSDLPFSQDASLILQELDEAEKTGNQVNE